MKCAQCDQTLYLGRCVLHDEPNPQTFPAKPTEQVTKPTELDQVDEIKPATDGDLWTWEHAGHLSQRLVRRLGARIRQDGARIAELEQENERLRNAVQSEAAQVTHELNQRLRLERWQRGAVPYVRDFAGLGCVTGPGHIENCKRLLAEAGGEGGDR